MKNDVCFEKDDFVFNYRVVLVFKQKNKILVQKDNRVNHLTLPGGRCGLGENTINTAIREFKEETGINCSLKRKIGIIENFFTSSFNPKKYHEILMIHEMKFDDEKNYDKELIHNIEEKKKDHLSFVWVDMNELKKSNFKPDIILDMIQNNEFNHCIIND